MLTEYQEAEYWAMHYYLGGDCNCCEYQGNCENFENLVFPSKDNCHWKFSAALVNEYKSMKERWEK